MSNRTLVELNHDFCPADDDAMLLRWAREMQRYMRSGDKRTLPYGVTFVHRRHHSEPCPVRDKPAEPPKLTARQEEVFIALDAVWRDPSDIARRAGIRTTYPRETAAKFCIQLVKLGVAERGGPRERPTWRLKAA